MADRKSKPLPELTPKQIARFYERVNDGAPSDCWPWTGYVDNKGYGRVNLAHGICLCAHRVAYLLATGIDPVGKQVCHHCDNPPCCNPHHFFIGTMADNMADRDRKGRGATGERSGSRKYPHLHQGENSGRHILTEDQVREIRARYDPNNVTAIDLALESGVSKYCIRNVVYRNRWKHI